MDTESSNNLESRGADKIRPNSTVTTTVEVGPSVELQVDVFFMSGMPNVVEFKLVASTSAATTGCGFRALSCDLQLIIKHVVVVTVQSHMVTGGDRDGDR